MFPCVSMYSTCHSLVCSLQRQQNPKYSTLTFVCLHGVDWEFFFSLITIPNSCVKTMSDKNSSHSPHNIPSSLTSLYQSSQGERVLLRPYCPPIHHPRGYCILHPGEYLEERQLLPSSQFVMAPPDSSTTWKYITTTFLFLTTTKLACILWQECCTTATA